MNNFGLDLEKNIGIGLEKKDLVLMLVLKKSCLHYWFKAMSRGATMELTMT